MNKPASARSWGREDYKDDAELTALYADFCSKLQLPPEWKYIGDVNVISDTQVYKNGVQVPKKGVCFTAGKLYRDTRTSGFNLKEYRVYWNSFSHHGGIVERQRPAPGEDWAKTCLIDNKTVEQLNKYIAEHFNEISTDKACLVSEENEDDNLKNLIEKIANL